MPLKPQKPPLLYLITSGETTSSTTPTSRDFSEILNLVSAAVESEINLVQLREKNLSGRVLYQLAEKAANLVQGSATSLLVNDRADIALAAGADGVHLSTRSLEAAVVRREFGEQFLIGVSTHAVAEVSAANIDGASFVVLGPVFQTVSKQRYGDPLGVEILKAAATTVTSFPVIALGGITLDNVDDCFRAGASGIAAIRLFQDPRKLSETVKRIRARF